MSAPDWQYVLDVFNDAADYSSGIEAAESELQQAYEQAYESLDRIGRAPSLEPAIRFDPTSAGATADTEQTGDGDRYEQQYHAEITVGKPRQRPVGADGEDEDLSLVGALQHELHHLYVRERLAQQDDWKEHDHGQYASVPVLDRGKDEAFSELLTYCVEADEVTTAGAKEYIETMTERYREHTGRTTAQEFEETASAIAERLPGDGSGLEQYEEASSFIETMIEDERSLEEIREDDTR